MRTCAWCGSHLLKTTNKTCVTCTAKVDYQSVEAGVLLYSPSQDKFARLIETHDDRYPIQFDFVNDPGFADLFPDVEFGSVYCNSLDKEDQEYLNDCFFIIPYEIKDGFGVITYFEAPLSPEEYVDKFYRSRRADG